MNIFGININCDLYALLEEDYDEKKRAEEVQQQMQQEYLGNHKKNKYIFY